MLLAEAGTINDPGLSEATGLLAQVVLQDTEDDELRCETYQHDG